MDYTKLLGKMAGEEEDKARLDAYLSSIAQKDPNSVVREGEMSLQPTPRKKPFEAEVLRARQEASDTPLGQLFGISPMSEEEKSFYDANRDEAVEQGMKMGQQFGMGMGGINNIAPKALQALKGAAQGVGKFATPQATQAPKQAAQMQESSDELAKMLQARNKERLEGALQRLEMQYNSPAIVGNEATKLGRKIVNIKDTLDKAKGK